MTDKEFERYQKAVEIKDQIDNIKQEIEYIDTNFNELGYPRSESGWHLVVRINDIYRKLSVSSEVFWELIALVKQRKLEELDKYKEQFEKL